MFWFNIQSFFSVTQEGGNCLGKSLN